MADLPDHPCRGVDGLNVVSDGFSVLVFAILDVLPMVVYGLMSVSFDEKATDLDLAEFGRAAQAPVAV